MQTCAHGFIALTCPHCRGASPVPHASPGGEDEDFTLEECLDRMGVVGKAADKVGRTVRARNP